MSLFTLPKFASYLTILEIHCFAFGNCQYANSGEYFPVRCLYWPHFYIKFMPFELHSHTDHFEDLAMGL